MNIRTRWDHHVFEHKPLLPAVALAVMLAGVTDSVLADPPAAAANTESVVETVSLADLDVSTPEGAPSGTRPTCEGRSAPVPQTRRRPESIGLGNLH